MSGIADDWRFFATRNSTPDFQLPAVTKFWFKVRNFGFLALCKSAKLLLSDRGLVPVQDSFASPTANALHYSNVVVASRKSSSEADEFSSVDGSN